MAELTKEEIRADAILDAATPVPAGDTSFPEITKKKPAVKRAAAKKPATATKKVMAEPIAEPSPTPLAPAEKPEANTPKKPSAVNDTFKKNWQRINSWGLGISGKVIILLIIIGVFSEIVGKL